ncbi:Tm-1-like ATP-binding domain-containing protein [Oscillochloris sp. ZM17-4]|uniref:Tm-1-like ATP-binding domain-containing protein n=1 Tax=Oscillochloris sp. ZM17-4 TaxID=2866714 RepID=UPI001C72B48D|nr:Tm-1-like ATP-binding domain-containing protein [Oscillochloris sp. ZM17-4]MBX0328325.1 Tm-1-like ATP-binding domain-containing protein [Oscillochloris sp. ZM17-4]
MATVVLLGTLDTKGGEFDFLRRAIQAAGCDTILVDAGILGAPQADADISREDVAAAAGADVAALAAAGDRGAAVSAMAAGATAVALRLFGEGRLHGIIGLGGTGNSALATEAMRALQRQPGQQQLGLAQGVGGRAAVGRAGQGHPRPALDDDRQGWRRVGALNRPRRRKWPAVDR